MRNARHARIAVILAAALALAALAGCSTPAAQKSAGGAKATSTGAAYPLTITDDAGRSVTIATQPKRLVSLAPANTEILYSLGKLGQVVGVTTYDDYPAQVADIAKIGDFQTPNLEAIASAKPDVIFITGGVQADVISKLEGVGGKVVVIDPRDIAGVYAAISTVGKVVGSTDRADEVVAGMKKDLAEIRTKIGSEPAVSCFVEIGWNPLYTAGPGTLIDDLVTQGGGTNVVKESGYVGYSVEQLLVDQPRVYLGTASSLTDMGTIDQRPGYKKLDAVISTRVVSLDDNLVSRPGPRIVQGVREIARALHPDRF